MFGIYSACELGSPGFSGGEVASLPGFRGSARSGRARTGKQGMMDARSVHPGAGELRVKWRVCRVPLENLGHELRVEVHLHGSAPSDSISTRAAFAECLIRSDREHQRAPVDLQDQAG